jgi:uncharacterized membrane protein HdeD (DUF308 family)
MATQDEASLTNPLLPNLTRRLRGALLLVMGGLAFLSPFFAGTLALFLVGVFLITCGALEMFETFQAADEVHRRSAYLSGTLSILAGTLLLAQPQLLLRGMAFVVAGTFLLDGFSKVVAALRTKARGAAWKGTLIGGLVNVLVAVVLAVQWPASGQALVAFVVALRMVAAGWSMLLNREVLPRPKPRVPVEQGHPDSRLGLPPHQEFGKLRATLKLEQESRRRIDAAWCLTFVLVFFAIHIGRMEVAWNLVGMVSPLVAVLGDVGTALVVAFVLILPCQLAWRWLTRPLERRGWKNLLARSDRGQGVGFVGWLSRGWLVRRLRFSWRMAGMLYSPRAALRWGLQEGLPVTAILIAVNPIWGFSWFFNSESWATEVWDRWAAARTDLWREQMVQAVEQQYQDKNRSNGALFQVTPEGVAGSADFSFLVLGDTGEGGAAQHSLRDQYLFLGQRPDVKFLAISSDVIYPSGAMSDYESKFYLPFKGFAKPIYAIPGNHDWYDALEAFAANFFEPDAARATMHARIVTDNRLTTTTDERIDGMIRQAARLRQEFGVKTGWQRGPFFEVQTERFALIAVDTGVLRRIETRQWEWLKAALEHSQGKTIMAILGHPLYAGGRYQAGDQEPFAGEWLTRDGPVEVLGQRLGSGTAPFAAIHQLLRQHQVDVVMAGDTHYFECYQEPYEADGALHTMHHFVNGGGGAYLSIGTPLDWPRQPALPNCASYPRKDLLIEKLDRETPAWKRPLWWWVRYLQGWPLTAEALAGAFLYSQAPYLQSFVEVRVETSRQQLRLIPHGANGPLRWRELELFGTLMPQGKTPDETVEFVIPMSRRPPSASPRG